MNKKKNNLVEVTFAMFDSTISFDVELENYPIKVIGECYISVYSRTDYSIRDFSYEKVYFEGQEISVIEFNNLKNALSYYINLNEVIENTVIKQINSSSLFNNSFSLVDTTNNNTEY